MDYTFRVTPPTFSESLWGFITELHQYVLRQTDCIIKKLWIWLKPAKSPWKSANSFIKKTSVLKLARLLSFYIKKCGKVRWSRTGVLSSDDLRETQGQRCLLNKRLSALINNGHIPREDDLKSRAGRDKDTERDHSCPNRRCFVPLITVCAQLMKSWNA